MALKSASSEYTDDLKEIVMVRDTVKGSPFVKRKRGVYLPHPSEVDRTSTRAVAKYNQYLAGAEFSEFPSQTLLSLLGRADIEAAAIEVPESLQYLVDDINGSGLDMVAAMQTAASESLQVNWSVLVADYKGLSGVKLDDLSIADAADLNNRATVISYRRESVIDACYESINGVVQLAYICLRTVGTVRNPATQEKEDVSTDLILALDENGDYYQQKNTDTEDGERNYIAVRGVRLKYIPAVVIADQTINGALPRTMGFVSPICELALSRYRVYAEYKEAMRALPPTTYLTGAKAGDDDLFKEMNQGRDYIETGAGSTNTLPKDWTVDVVGTNGTLEDYRLYLENNTREVRALGGVFKTDNDGNTTATEVRAEASETSAKLSLIASSIEAGFTELVFYCGVFEGAFQHDGYQAAADAINISLSREFASSKLTLEEAKALVDIYFAGLYSKERTLKELVVGGWSSVDADTLLTEVNESGAAPLPTTNGEPVASATQ